jgi:hypothetical protein
MWKEFYKNGEVYTYEMNYMYSGKRDREERLIADGWLPVFDRRTLSFNNGRAGSIILENDHTPPDSIINLQKELITQSHPKCTHNQYCCLHPGHVPEIKKLIEAREVKNILIESLFKDRDQLRYIIRYIFSNYLDINFLIDSKGSLIETLQDELDNHMDQYDMRNSYYVRGPEQQPYFNDLTFTLLKNRVYEYDVNSGTMQRIKFRATYEKCEVFYEGKYKFIFGNYETNDDDISIKEEKPKWK